jgi:cytochrome c-type biogenesis protein CcmH
MESVQQRNIAIARERALEINSAFDAGELNQAEYDQAKSDLEIALADELATSKELDDQFRSTSKTSRYIILALVPLLAYGSYRLTSNYDPNPLGGSMQTQDGKAPSFEDLLGRLEEKVINDPQDQQGLFLLAQTYSRMGRFEDSAARFEQLIEITEPSADLYASLADVQAMANEQIFDEKISNTLDKALALNPQHVSALWLGGLAKQQLGDPETALKRWLILKPILKDDAESSQELATLIKDVSQQLGAKAAEIGAAMATSLPTSSDLTPEVGVTIKVSLAAEFAAEINPSDTVFIYAKAKTGPPMPLAASRQPVSALPITVTLDDSMALLPQMKLSSFSDVLVGARISASGQAIAQSGDLESELVATQNTVKDIIELVISKRKP